MAKSVPKTIDLRCDPADRAVFAAERDGLRLLDEEEDDFTGIAAKMPVFSKSRLARAPA
jgi:hypothetical protein